MPVDEIGLKRWQFRKKKKVEKRRQKRQLNAEKNQPKEPVAVQSVTDQVLEKQKYQQQKELWEEREEKFKLIELAKKAAKEKEEQDKAKTQKRWHDTLLNLPMMPTQFTLDKTHKSTFKTFVQSDIEPILVPKKTYRERFLERKQAKKKD
ncbi:hypothetical protein BDF21DRAFT_394730 [Thamnidium elegans]|nr:hypothetical protein BDF21DRAFT_394730 [Thamnidium elegans]